MTEKRDLKADLSRLDKLGHVCMEMNYEEYEQFVQTYHRDWLKRAVHEQKRADKAEALVRELVDVLGRVTPRYLVGRLELDLDLVHEANGLLKKAKEVLGDEETCAGR